ncbi:unnamed protein product [Fusarium graminearum]|nr:unnamed protein product [Fusarium graminearum]
MSSLVDCTRECSQLFWLSMSLGGVLIVSISLNIGLMHRVRRYHVEVGELKPRLYKFQDAYQDSKADRAGLHRDRNLLVQDLEKCQQASYDCWCELTSAHAFCRENHTSLRHLKQPEQPERSDRSVRSDFSFQPESTDGDGLESRAEWAKMGPARRGKPNLTALANGEAIHHVVNGRYQVPQQVQFGDLIPINHGTDVTQNYHSLLQDYAQAPWDPTKDPDAQNDAHAGHGQRG